jgi:predicted outer membrane protein
MSMTSRVLMISAIAVAAAGLAGCGEKASVTVSKQGKYQGKPDNLPWQGAPFNNNQAEWENAIKARTIGQNEYVRVGS